MKNFENVVFGLAAAFWISLFIAVIVVAFAGCSPRSALYCSQDMQWVQCPSGVKAGTNLDKLKRK